MDMKQLTNGQWVHFEGRSIGICDKHMLLARNIQKDQEEKPEWRIAEKELIRWLRVKGFRYHERKMISH
jgi:hypothetical protein